MKKGIGVMLLGLILLLAACGDDSTKEKATESKQIENTDSEKITAWSTYEGFMAAGIPMYRNVVFTDETDPNGLLGRPHSYTAKIDFNDKTAIDRIVAKNLQESGLPKSETGDQVEQRLKIRTGGTIEEFKTKKDLEDRMEYLNELPVKTDVDNEYRYSKGNVLLRIDASLTPSEAKKYETAFMAQK
ncbi:hypothetical protein [Listeria booriae]|uniref:hypothetical protein n=1 Tax=Listeria booriae TaxID=1552123 RepID=UPI001626A5BE|nr:hypothetical protein [Listeria booriae]MBC2207451.1 hypothetical protein [Listeria booriae]